MSLKNREGIYVEKTLFNDYKVEGLINIDISNKIKSVQCSWIRRLYDNSFHKWKLIPLYLIRKSFGSSFKFHSNLFLKEWKSSFFYLYIEIFCTGKSILSDSLKYHLSFILSQYYPWYNENIQVDKNSI